MAESSSQSVGPGGFVRTLPSPAPSTTSTTRSTANLPHPRGRPLIPGSAKEDTVRNYVEGQLLYINRRYIKKFAVQNPDDKVTGYKSMGELCKDAEGLVNILWLSATPSLQIPYLLNIAGEFTEWLTHFPPSPTATFSLLRKLDHCFASLLLGRDIETREPLPGFEDGPHSGMSGTDKVRCRSLVEQTRILVVDVMSKEPPQVEEVDEEADYDTPMETESESEGAASRGGAYGEDDDDDGLDMDVAKVYENTLVQLGEPL
ncbi:hypothetical protein CONLIGDRAFT_409487 [Coniochaeta ligniaria NRRL 30616]|uniref:Meiotic recombination protein DMC1 n=1 Tax=Coniochaeta ligniaria NRRL 30616 TaxID=1408157 RepID=A0A1J7JN75_9PEZI|nr:hypothetical protein CONLIGDRAFT_409487 [Coniochaeta ligniaria NRRL 30616]